MEYGIDMIWNEALTCKQQTKHHMCPQWPLGGYVMGILHFLHSYAVLLHDNMEGIANQIRK